ncbi:hypothetical protein O9929_20180 [Vibrio lentus]|nr:hypothetical protein [Vibrio lentus]
MPKQIRQYQSRGQWQELDILLTDTFIYYRKAILRTHHFAARVWYFSGKLHSKLPAPSDSDIYIGKEKVSPTINLWGDGIVLRRAAC